MEVTVKRDAFDYFAACRYITPKMFAASPLRFIVGLLGGMYGFLSAIS